MKMEPIYNQNGRTVGWLKENIVYDIDSSPCAFIRNSNIFNYEGDYLGRLNRGFFRDKDGNAVAFVRGASGGPIPPIPEIAPLPPIPDIPPIPPIPAVPPVLPIPSLNWSNISWEEFLKEEVFEMASLNMEGPYRLTIEKIDELVTITSPGNYALCNVKDNTFYVDYVGRSDDDVNGRLKQWVRKKPSRYTHFNFSYATSPKAAFEKECINYHDFGESDKLDNEYHPSRPDGTDWKCSVCNIFD